MTDRQYLPQLRTGEQAVVSDLDAIEDMRRRLQDIGLIKGTRVECLGKSPLGDPVAYLIRGAVIALRCEDAESVMIETLD